MGWPVMGYEVAPAVPVGIRYALDGQQSVQFRDVHSGATFWWHPPEPTSAWPQQCVYCGRRGSPDYANNCNGCGAPR